MTVAHVYRITFSHSVNQSFILSVTHSFSHSVIDSVTQNVASQHGNFVLWESVEWKPQLTVASPGFVARRGKAEN